ncbi:Uncharacterised protein [Serratia fonticola]|nr:Uncharacterised protein [Serratia fonticola]
MKRKGTTPSVVPYLNDYLRLSTAASQIGWFTSQKITELALAGGNATANGYRRGTGTCDLTLIGNNTTKYITTNNI